MRFDDPELVRREYASEERLLARKRVHEEFRTGSDAHDVVLDALREAAPRRVLEVGCGLGDMACRIADELGCEVVGVDLSRRMVELARARGVDARVGDVQDLRFEAETFDCAVAAWMLYHVPDLDCGLAELARVLRAGGRLVASTLAEDNLIELWRALGDERPARELPFSRENGAEPLRRHFARVECRDVPGEIVFPTRRAIHDYVTATIAGAERAAAVESLQVPFRAHSPQAVFVAEKAA
ncbi:MAG: class I SAM-dependent methyltransferase [Gaiellaceae bacterium]